MYQPGGVVDSASSGEGPIKKLSLAKDSRKRSNFRSCYKVLNRRENSPLIVIKNNIITTGSVSRVIFGRKTLQF